MDQAAQKQKAVKEHTSNAQKISMEAVTFNNVYNKIIEMPLGFYFALADKNTFMNSINYTNSKELLD